MKVRSLVAEADRLKSARDVEPVLSPVVPFIISNQFISVYKSEFHRFLNESI